MMHGLIDSIHSFMIYGCGDCGKIDPYLKGKDEFSREGRFVDLFLLGRTVEDPVCPNNSIKVKWDLQLEFS
jgi:hypothetical protein